MVKRVFLPRPRSSVSRTAEWRGYASARRELKVDVGPGPEFDTTRCIRSTRRCSDIAVYLKEPSDVDHRVSDLSASRLERKC